MAVSNKAIVNVNTLNLIKLFFYQVIRIKAVWITPTTKCSYNL
jgi:hypothetical protein